MPLHLARNPTAWSAFTVDHAATIFKPEAFGGKGFFEAVYRTSDQRAGHLAALAAAGIKAPESKHMRDLTKRVRVLTFQLNGSIGLPSGHRPPGMEGKAFSQFYELITTASQTRTWMSSVIDVLLRSSAAPIAFPVYQGFSDGGLVAINPSVCAIAQAVNPPTGGAEIGDLRVLSFGTGRGATHSLDIGTANWGLIQWAKHAGRFGDRFIDAFADIPTFQAQQLLGERYLRLNPPIPHNAGVDRPSDIPDLIEAADAFGRPPEWATAVSWVKKVVATKRYPLTDGRSSSFCPQPDRHAACRRPP